MGVGGGLDRLFDLVCPTAVAGGKDVAMPVRHDRVRSSSGTDLLAPDDQRNLDLVGSHGGQSGLDGIALRCPGRVASDRLVLGWGTLYVPFIEVDSRGG